MNGFKVFFIRAFQKIMYVACFFLNFNEPEIIKGEDSFSSLAELLKSKGHSNALVVVGPLVHKLNLDDKALEALVKNNISYQLYTNITPNPKVFEVEDGVKVYKDNKCDCIIAIGGGSVLDAAKMIGARITNPNKSVKKMKGLLKITHKLPLFIAVPTTAGTGSETTIAAVILDEKTKDKFPVEDPHLMPNIAVLNPTLLVSLPDNVTSTTGMDALTHAVEAYIGSANTKKTKRFAIEAVDLIFKNLYKTYENPSDLQARENMQLAAYDAGVAFTRAYVGYVHALAHALGAFYHVPHGLANAIILPYVLKEFKESAHKKLAQLYDVIEPNSGLSIDNKASKFIERIEELNAKMNIPSDFKDIIKDEDLDALVNHSYSEAVPLYPTPKIWGKDDFKRMYIKLQGHN